MPITNKNVLRLYRAKPLDFDKLTVPVYEPILIQMLKTSKQILITTEHREICIVRHNGHPITHGFCFACSREVEMLSIDAAITLAGIGGRLLIENIKRGTVHSTETATGHLLVCRNSLKK